MESVTSGNMEIQNSRNMELQKKLEFHYSNWICYGNIYIHASIQKYIHAYIYICTHKHSCMSACQHTNLHELYAPMHKHPHQCMYCIYINNCLIASVTYVTNIRYVPSHTDEFPGRYYVYKCIYVYMYIYSCNKYTFKATISVIFIWMKKFASIFKAKTTETKRQKC